MTLDEIKSAVRAGYRVCHHNPGYVVLCDSIGQWLIKYAPNGYCIGLTHSDGLTMNGKPEEFFIDRSTPAAQIRAMRADLDSAQTLQDLDCLYIEWIGYSTVEDNKDGGFPIDAEYVRGILSDYIKEMILNLAGRVEGPNALDSDYKPAD